MLQAGEVKTPVSLFNDIVILEVVTLSSLVEAGNGEVTFYGVEGKVDSETLVGLINEGGEFVYGDGSITESEDSAHLRSIESNTRNGSNFSELHSIDLNITKLGNIAGDSSSDGT